MTPKQKASEIGNKFYRGNVFTHSKEQHLIELEFARQNAIICVDEILNLFILEFKWDKKHNGNIDYWEEVKQEIALL